MSTRRTVAVFLLLPLFVLLERAAWYGSYAILTVFRTADPMDGGLGMSWEDAAGAASTLRLLIPAFILLGGLLAVGLGPWTLLALGALVALTGMVLLGLPLPATAGLAILLLTLGHGLTMPGVMSSAAAALRGRAENLRTAVVALVYLCLNLGALAGSLGGGAAHPSLGFQPVFLACAGGLLLALLVAALLGGAVLWTRAEVKAKPEPVPTTGRLLGGAALLMVLVFVPWMGSLQIWELAWKASQAVSMPPWLADHWFDVNPLTCIATATLAALVSCGLHVARVRVPALFPMAAGLLLLALGSVIVLVTGTASYPALLVGLALNAMGEALLMIFFTSRLLGDLHWRAVTPVYAVWLAAVYGGGQLLSWLGGWLDLPWWSHATTAIGIGSAVLVAVALAIMAIPARRKLWRVEAS